MRRVIALTAALALLGTAATATVSNEALISDLSGKGFTRVEIKHGLTQLRVQAIRGKMRLELVLDAETGLVLRQRTGKIRLFDNTAPGAFVTSRSRDFVTEPAVSSADRSDRPAEVASAVQPEARLSAQPEARLTADLATQPTVPGLRAAPAAMAFAMPVYQGDQYEGDKSGIGIDGGFWHLADDWVYDDGQVYFPIDPLPIDRIGDGVPPEGDDGGIIDIGIWDEGPGDQILEEPFDDSLVDDGSTGDVPVDETVTDEGGGGDEPPADDPPADDPPAYEGPAYEGPAYEGPAYEEPAPDGTGDEVSSMPAEIPAVP